MPVTKWIPCFKKYTVIAVFLLGGSISMVCACAPWFPNWLLIRGDQEILKAPSSHYKQELRRISQDSSSMYKTVRSDKNEAEQTLDAALQDLRASLMDSSMDLPGRAQVLEDHRVARKSLIAYRKALHQWGAGSDLWLLKKPEPPAMSAPEVTKGLPTEFALYFEGAIAFHQSDFAKARSRWLKVLELPESQRRYRSIWAEFMLGKLDVDTHPDHAIIRFRHVRSLVDQGFVDSLGLAASSLGWAARSYLRKSQYREAIDLYLEQLNTGDVPSADVSIRWTLDRAFREGPRSFADLAQTPKIRRVVTAYLTSRHRSPWDLHIPEEIELVNAWVSAVEAATSEKDPLFELLALAVYQRGLYDLSERLLGQAPRDGILSAWLHSKLLFRKGHIQEAMDMLTQVVEHFPNPQDMDTTLYASGATRSLIGDQPGLIYRSALSNGSDQPQGELGLHLLHRGEFIKAMDTLLRAGYWMDGAYVAERVLSLDELKEYVDRNWPAFSPNASPLNGGRFSTLEETTHYRIRYLLARRLARENQDRETTDYYPSKWREQHQLLAMNLIAGRSSAQPPALRAKALWDAARTTRYFGLELIATELGPDWAIHDGNFEEGVTLKARQFRDGNTKLTPTKEELRRAAETRLEPFQRYHYRFIAADIAWNALQWMPDNEVDTARAFCEAGAWIKNINPKAADRFYKALVRRCPDTEIGKAAEQLHWFPALDENGNLAIDKPKPPDSVSVELKLF